MPTVAEPKAKLEWTVTVLDAGKYVSQGQIGTDLGPESKSAAPRIVLGIKEPKFWSPDSPFLYDVKVTLKSDGKVVDEVTSYFGMRKIHVGKDQAGINRLMLNNEPLFQFGPLDQGFWPDGLYTAPSDEALKYDLEITKKLGFNMARKHVKVEPDRWYYHCDKWAFSFGRTCHQAIIILVRKIQISSAQKPPLII
jgi:beta-galactosidase/beta-glucuronidase